MVRTQRLFMIKIAFSFFALFSQEQHYINQDLPYKSGKSAGTELLIRVPDPAHNGAYLNTEEFIIQTARNGQLRELTTHIIDKVIRNAHLLDTTKAPYYINVPPPLISPTFAKELAIKLSNAGLPSNLIGIELTEREAILDQKLFNAGMKELQQLGIPLALDDYGRGLATRDFLTDLPVGRVKIDRGALCDAQKNSDLKQQLRLDIEFMHKAGMEVIAEGIETEDDCTFAMNLGCDGIQGYFFDRPKMLIPVDA